MNDHPIRGGAVLYTVQGPRGSYYAVHDPASGRIFTESTDPRARAQAREKGLIVVNEETITHQELLRRTGREADAATQAPKTNPTPQPLASPGSIDGVDGVTVLPPQLPFLLDDTGESVIVRQGVAHAALFSSHPLEPRFSDLSDDGGIWGNMPVLHPPEEDWKAPER
jgi:hypothetical protein